MINDNENIQICSRCIFDSNVPAIIFDSDGVCNYCKMIDQLKEEYQTGEPEGERKFFKIIDELKKAGRKKKYDCVIGVSGGVDSSFMVHMAVEWGLRPLAVHYDNTWNTAIATENIKKVLGKLKVDLYTHVVDNKEIDDLFKSFFYAGVPELDGSTDLALAEVLYRAASKYKVKYILEGHSFITEGVSPLGSVYFDGKYIASIQKKFGNIKLKTYPNMTFLSFIKWILFKRIRKIRPLWYIAYSKEEAKLLLEKKYGWEYYGGHHLENRMSAFNHSIYFPQKFGIDLRNLSLSAMVRCGNLSREEAINLYKEPPYIEDELLSYFLKRLELTKAEYEAVMSEKPKCYKDYKTYKKLFELLRPFFYVMYRANLVPKSFYIKYTSKSGI